MRKVTASSSSALDRNQSHVHEHIIYSQNRLQDLIPFRSWWCDQVRLTVGFKSGLRLMIVIIDRSFCNFYSCISSVRVLPWSQSDLQPLSRSTEAQWWWWRGSCLSNLWITDLLFIIRQFKTCQNIQNKPIVRVLTKTSIRSSWLRSWNKTILHNRLADY